MPLCQLRRPKAPGERALASVVMQIHHKEEMELGQDSRRDQGAAQLAILTVSCIAIQGRSVIVRCTCIATPNAEYPTQPDERQSTKSVYTMTPVTYILVAQLITSHNADQGATAASSSCHGRSWEGPRSDGAINSAGMSAPVQGARLVDIDPQSRGADF